MNDTKNTTSAARDAGQKEYGLYDSTGNKTETVWASGPQAAMDAAELQTSLYCLESGQSINATPLAVRAGLKLSVRQPREMKDPPCELGKLRECPVIRYDDRGAAYHSGYCSEEVSAAPAPLKPQGGMYAAFRAMRFSHSECNRALRALGYAHNAARANKGGDLSDKQKALVEKLASWTEEVRQTWSVLAAEYGSKVDASIAAKVQEDMARERLAEWLKDPKSKAELDTLSQAEADRWWKEEGRFEAEIEERGELKYYHHERERAGREGRDLTAQGYLAGESADDEE